MIDKIKRYLIAGSILAHTGKFIVSIPSRVRKLITRIRKKLDYMIGFLIRRIIYSRGNVENNKIFFMTFDDSYSCNARYIADEVLRQKLPIQIVWVVPAKGKIIKNRYPEGAKLVRRGSYTMFEEQSSSKVWIDNALNCVWYGMPKKKEQVYINTWHGSMGIKRLNGSKTWMYRARRCNKQTDYCITNSAFEEQVFHDTFWPDVPYLRFGHARNDILFSEEAYEVLTEKVYSFFRLNSKQPVPVSDESFDSEITGECSKIEKRKKLLLYAPTFRDSGKTNFKAIDYARLKTVLEERFGGEWIILIRTHFKDRAQKTNIKFNSWLKNASNYEDMQELLAVVDIGITDYSSWAYDYVLTRKPVFLYTPDLDTYDQARGFYYPLESTPFPLAKNNDQLAEEILNFDNQHYQKRVSNFLKDKGCYEDGHASERAVKKIKEIIGIETLCEAEA